MAMVAILEKLPYETGEQFMLRIRKGEKLLVDGSFSNTPRKCWVVIPKVVSPSGTYAVVQWVDGELSEIPYSYLMREKTAKKKRGEQARFCECCGAKKPMREEWLKEEHNLS